MLLGGKVNSIDGRQEGLCMTANAANPINKVVGIVKNGDRHLKKVTVVTVTYNAEKQIEKTIKSVVGQKFNDFEYIVIDGLSIDGTLSEIMKHKENIDVIVSEPDGGIYDAMNKAIGLAKGEWIIFINADDWFVNDMVLSDVFCNKNIDVDFLYGDNEVYNGVKSIFVPVRPLSKMWQRISFSHQSLFSKTRLMRKYPFDVNKNIVADYDFYFSCYVRGFKFKYIEKTVSVVSVAGFSGLSFSKRTWQRWMVVAKEWPSIKVHAFYVFLFLWHPLPVKLKRVMKNNIKIFRDFT